MKEDLEVAGLHEIYKQTDAEGRKKMISAAAELLEAQKILKNEEGIGNKASEQDVSAHDVSQKEITKKGVFHGK